MALEESSVFCFFLVGCVSFREIECVLFFLVRCVSLEESSVFCFSWWGGFL